MSKPLRERLASINDKSQINISTSLIQNISTLTEIRHFYKIILLGSIGVGKTSISKRISENIYSDEYIPSQNNTSTFTTIRMDDSSNTFAEIGIIDTCSSQEYRPILLNYCKDVKGCIIIYDISNRQSYDDIEHWIKDIRLNGDEDAIIILAGNKSDLNKERAVTFDEANKLAERYKFDYFEISARTGLNIELLFEFLCKSIIKKAEDDETNKNNGSLDRTYDYSLLRNNSDNKRKKRCCDYCVVC